MELLDRYLEAVRKHLPWKRQDDILAELRANLEAQLEDKESELGRPLSKDEAEAWLKQIGSPMQVAARYLPQQYLIGPAVFPMYWFVLRTVFLWATVIYAIVSVVLLVTAGTYNAQAIVEAFLRLPVVWMNSAAWVTLIFLGIEYAATHYPEKCPGIVGANINWSPASLPPVPVHPPAGMKRPSYAKAVAEVIFGYLFLIWWLLVPRHPYLMFGPAAAYLQASPYQLAPIMMVFYWWILVLNAVQLAWNCVELWRGRWQRPLAGKEMIFKAIGLVPMVQLATLHDHVYILLKRPALEGLSIDVINDGIYKVITIVCAIVAVQLVYEIGKFSFETYRRRVAVER